eukprot:Nitzschia sp. Nitz4//scaffold322_size40381//15710//16867//NITZ4_007560-RA/size40381-processed-gene-0.21-mRNA-1//-1//CDS//3329547827//718//frame0
MSSGPCSSTSSFKALTVFVLIMLYFYNVCRPKAHVDSEIAEGGKGRSSSQPLYDQGDNGTWLEVKHSLCPAGIPDTSFGERLFELAGYILRNRTAVSPDPVMIEHFYQGFFDDKESMSIYVDDQKAFAYVRIFKCGNNFIRAWTEKWYNHHSTPSNATAFFKMGVRANVAVDQLSRYREDQSRSPPCIVTAVRDPISHFLSAYNEIEWRTSTGIYHSESKDRPAYLDIPVGTDEDRKARFTEFVYEVISGNWKQFQPFGRLHFTSMSRVLAALNERGLSLTAYLPSVENLRVEWPAFVEQTCPGMGQQLVKDQHLGSHESSEDELGFYKAAKSVWEESGDAAKALCVVHAMDYACWDELPGGIPLVCRELFNEQYFRDAILGKKV